MLYFIKRFLLIIPTLFFVMVVNFLIVQLAPGGPIEQISHKLKEGKLDSLAGLEGEVPYFPPEAPSAVSSKYYLHHGLPPEFIKKLEKQYGYDQPLWKRFWLMIKNYAKLNFGKSYFLDAPVMDLISTKIPVSLSLGLWSTLIIYFISIPLGIVKARFNGGRFDILTTLIIAVGHAIPTFLFGIILIIFFAGGTFWDVFPLRGLTSEGWQNFSFWQKIGDYLWHITLPVLSIIIGGFASLTMITKNSFLEEWAKPYVITAYAKGASTKRVLYGHVFRNASLALISGFPSAFAHIFLTSNLVIEIIFSLDGLGLLGFEASMNRDYPLMFGLLFVFTLTGMILHLIGDLLYKLADPRINFIRYKG